MEETMTRENPPDSNTTQASAHAKSNGGYLLSATLRRMLLSCLLLIASLFALLQFSNITPAVIADVQLSINEQAFTPAALPLKRNIIGNYQVQLTLNPGDRNSQKLQIIPDDELLRLSVNGREISLAGYSRSDLRNYSKGIFITLTDLQPGQANTIELGLSNSSNPAGLEVKPIHTLSLLHWLGLLVSLLLLVYTINRHIKLSGSQYLLLTLGLIAALFYLSKTDSYTRTFDVYEGGGHRDYIEYLIEHRTAPPPGDGWEYHQPPLYYVIAALSKVFFVGDDPGSDFWGQLLALWFWTIFLFASLASLGTAFAKKSWGLLIASAALCFWPAGIIHSIRIGNDLPLYAFYALAFYYTLHWWRGHATRDLWYASLWASMALLTKSNALAVWGVIGVLFLVHSYRLWQHRHERPQLLSQIRKNFAILTACFVVTMALNFGDNLWHYYNGTSSDWLLSNVSESINPGLKVENKPVNYLVFDSATFIQNPFISTWDDRYGRQYFWNFVWRSSLTAEFFFNGKVMASWGIINGVLLLMMLTGLATYTIQQNTLMNRQQWFTSVYRKLPWLLAVIMPFLLLLAYRIKVPLSCNTDFRYIYPVLLPILFFSALVWRQFPRFKLSWLLASGAPLIAVSTWVWLLYL